MEGETSLSDTVTFILTTSAMLIMIAAIIGFAFIFQRKLTHKERAYRDIEKLLHKQEIKSAYSLIEGQEHERKRIAADIHDNVGNLLATLKMYSDLVVSRDPTSEVQRLGTKIGEITDAITKEIRKISHSLDSGAVQNFGLKAAIEHLAEAIEQSNKLNFQFYYGVETPLTSEKSLHVYRMVQELITNTLKHAQASKARLDVSQTNGEITIIFEDNGVGFNPAIANQSGMGLQNIRSRVGYLNGDIRIESNSMGSTFIIEFPHSTNA